ncbi:hypothetical protein L1987_33793 [Smallanthus sonchifolius]|uniref:Uncharacterized protein n=1 Tax=Smallanthus sonchifolius TaxID=185202 RepID=A0ACB9HSQ1_9ASTR|nr:hypothetical protein L1987_33793 [Smallanthus sonchifolius]
MKILSAAPYLPIVKKKQTSGVAVVVRWSSTGEKAGVAAVRLRIWDERSDFCANPTPNSQEQLHYLKLYPQQFLLIVSRWIRV